MKILVNKQKCPQNHVCPSIKVCSKGAISQETPFSLPVVDAEKCIVCGKCMQFCPMGAFEKWNRELNRPDPGPFSIPHPISSHIGFRSP